jgi:hypothetical protein
LNTQIQIFWTTEDPEDPIHDWRSWLDSRIGIERWDWTWWYAGVVAGESDERTVIALAFADHSVVSSRALMAAFILECEPEVYSVKDLVSYE